LGGWGDFPRRILTSLVELIGIGLGFLLLVVFMVVMIALGLAAFRALEHRVRMRGTLGQH